MAKAVVFDLFETLITEWGHEKFTKRAMSEALDLPPEAFSECWESLHERQYRGGITFEDSIRTICAQLHTNIDEHIIAQIAEKRRRTKAACFNFLHPEILPMLTALRERGFKLAILSNCSGEEVEIARESVLAPMVDNMILSHETGLCKPERGIYRLAAESLGVACEDCVYIGDGGSCELYGAADAGMHPYRAMWYIRAMPCSIHEQPEFEQLEFPSDLLRVFHEVR